MTLLILFAGSDGGVVIAVAVADEVAYVRQKKIIAHVNDESALMANVKEAKIIAHVPEGGMHKG